MPETEKKCVRLLVKHRHILYFIVVTFLAYMARKGGMDHISGDMGAALIPWYEEIVQGGGFNALSHGVGDYNVLYQTLICLFSYIPLGALSPMYLYKAVSIFFDFLLALVCAWIVTREKGENYAPKIFCIVYSIVLMVPSIVLNSSVWGQCDSMYTTLCILSLYWLYKEKYCGSFILLGIAFGLKLQTVFVVPVFFYYYISRQKFSLCWFLVALGAFWATGIPAYLAGRPLTTVFDIYLHQASEYPEMIMNSISIWYFFFPQYKVMKLFAILLTGFLLGLFLYHLLNVGGKLRETPQSFFTVAAWSAWTCLLFLPAMHDRYGYLLDSLLILLCFFDLKFLKYAAIQVLSSGIVYTSFLFSYKSTAINPTVSSVAAAIASLASIAMWLSFSVRPLIQCCDNISPDSSRHF